jgi:hypothetical protein
VSERWSVKGGRSYPARQGTPPPFSFFAPPRPPAGRERFGLTLAAIRLEIEGLDLPLADALRARFGVYADGGEPASDAAMRIRLAREPREYFIDPPEAVEFNPVWIACEGRRIRYVGHALAGWFDTAERQGEILLASGTYEPEIRAIENFIRCAVAWCAAERGGALVHAASVVRKGKAYLFYGESGAGKSTLSAADTRGRVVSDDLSLVLPRPGGGLDLVGTPFRGTYEDGAPVVGRFPLAAGFRIVQAASAEVRNAPRAIAFGQLVGNLTFVAEAFRERPDLFASVEAAFAGVPLHHLHFRKDDSYWDAIDAAGL